MGENPTNWRQLRLSNLLLSMALFGVALAIGKAMVATLGAGDVQPLHPYSILVCGLLIFIGASIGGIFGRAIPGAFIGLGVFLMLFFVLVVLKSVYGMP